MLASFPRRWRHSVQKPWQSMFSITRLSFDAPSPGNPRENLESFCYILVADSNFHGGLRKTHVFWNRVHNDPSRSSRVVNFRTNRKHVCNFLLVINSNLGPILPCFRGIAGFLLKIAPDPYTTRIWRCSPWTRLSILGLLGSKTLSWLFV